MRKRVLNEVGFWLLLVTILFGGWALNFAERPLQILGCVIFLAAMLVPLFVMLGTELLRSIQRIRGPDL